MDNNARLLEVGYRISMIVSQYSLLKEARKASTCLFPTKCVKHKCSGGHLYPGKNKAD